MIACIDVAYLPDSSRAACVMFEQWTDAAAKRHFAKSRYGDAPALEVVRGSSRHPLYVSAAVSRFRLATVADMRQNPAFAFLYNAFGIPIAAGVLYPLTPAGRVAV